MSDQEKQKSGQKTPDKLTLKDIRSVLADKSLDGFTHEVRALILKYDVEKLSEIDPKHYPDLLLGAAKIGLKDGEMP